ncbi:MAG: endonuclease MutS2 [Treponema sp.]|jgi:DNA mismatch repair protein MutS2|nr:endonuclease MutS2 [Treponema sp.]
MIGTKTADLLEFDAIRERVAACALSGEAAHQILAEVPRKDSQEVGTLKTLVSAVLDRMHADDGEPRESLPDIGFLLPKLTVEGMVLEIDEAYALGLFVERAWTLRNWLARGDRVYEVLVSAVPDCTAVSREVFRVLDKEGKLRDLNEFREINQRIRSLSRDLEALITRYTGNEESRRMLQSTVPSQRDGRMVLAVKTNFRGRIKGIVHEVSATGQTLFVEPGEVVEKNNDILIERRRLDAEILRVLRDMTGRIAAHGQALGELHEGIIRVETIRAKARYAWETGGHFAQDNQGSSITLKKARHPLLGPQGVPIDFSMDTDTTTVIITGPNTGGKTVALKTVGLFTLMNQMGLALPAEEGTALPVFDGVYADIGDEQSLSQSLSTFSAHMTNIADMVTVATARSLVLLDELGSGTDPAEGSAIAMAILDHLIEKGTHLIVTTHHGILKNYGYTREGVENASVEFDGRTLSPTYRIIMGLPGESHAVDIASRNGLPQDIITRARTYLTEEQSDVSALIIGLKKKHQELDAAAEMRRLEEQQLREERRQADLRELRLRQQEVNLKAGSIGNLRLLLTESRKTLENLVREVREGELTREKTVAVKEFLHNLEQTVIAEDMALEAEGSLLMEEKRRLDADRERQASQSTVRPISPGVLVLAGEYKRRGTVLRAGKKGTWIVAIGSLRMSFSEDQLTPLPPSEEVRKPLIATADLVSDTTAQFEISLRGMRLEAALETLRRQIDAAVLSGLHEFSVIHGKGDGILQRGVHEFLKEQPSVADYYFSRPELGGFGRTEVILKY